MSEPSTPWRPRDWGKIGALAGVIGVVATLAGIVVTVLIATGGISGGGATSPTEPQRPNVAATKQVSVKSDTRAYAGPSDEGGYTADASVATGEQVGLVCALYGAPVGTAHNRLWYYTQQGWLSDHFLATYSIEPLVNECTGDLNSPTVGDAPPNVRAGPFAVFTDQGRVDVRSAASLTAGIVKSIPDHALVSLQCSVATGPVVPAPRALGPSASNNNWDKIAQPPGWIPDSFVASYSGAQSSAPRC